ncbi:hypothetical protein LEAN103870_07775 [Legionella anisa]|uniref:Uncharacterized protein n=1 Tax=Legionella anisa TaxID=28082 RepID=A0AAX0WSK4_9GAMM|nr:hypothetical protein [Legionella anisa]AWN74498.1 hypothetical protein DLD14_11925 [Legionella anisa]KTC70435.1 hypothetical protein Lani_1982 [Legionella anisa]MBN5936765.1 hypothetical protein [Legionella anisa]MCW8425392.1 hypothetical protein [Legionella anisa]MCW8449177.1 hypothetical protein [Legionella anisa]
MITKAGAEYLLTTYATLFSISEGDERYILIRTIYQALQAVRDARESNPSIEELIKDLGKVKFRHQFYKVLDEEKIKDQFNDLVNDLLDDDNLEIKATHIPSPQMHRISQRKIL